MTTPRELAYALRNRTGYDLNEAALFIEAQARVCDAARKMCVNPITHTNGNDVYQLDTAERNTLILSIEHLDALGGKK